MPSNGGVKRFFMAFYDGKSYPFSVRPWTAFRQSPFILGWSYHAAAATAKSLQSCLTLCNPIDGSPPGFPVPGILQNIGVGCHFLLQCMKVKSESEVAQSCPTLVTPWTAAYQAPPSMGFSRQKYWSEVPLPSPVLPWMAPKPGISDWPLKERETRF